MLYDIYKVGQSQTNPWGIIDFPKETRLSQERTEQMMSADAYSGKSIIQKVLRLCCQNSQVGSYFVCAILHSSNSYQHRKREMVDELKQKRTINGVS